jgi:hypothetical protein
MGNATLQAGQALENLLAGKDPAVQKAILEQNQKAIGQIADQIGALNGDQTKTLLGNLSRAAQSVGTENAGLLTGAIAPRLKESLVQDPNNPQTAQNLNEFTDALRGSIAQGDGPLFGMSLAESLRAIEEPGLATAVDQATTDGLNDLRRDLLLSQRNFLGNVRIP